MKRDGGFRKNESLAVLMALGFEKALRNRLAAEKRHLREVKKIETFKRYRFEI
jgi:hypothetical protein